MLNLCYINNNNNNNALARSNSIFIFQNIVFKLLIIDILFSFKYLCAVWLSMDGTIESGQKHVTLWTQQDVMVWTDTLGPWAKTKIAPILLDYDIGTVL